LGHPVDHFGGAKSLKQPQWRRAVLEKSVISSSVSAGTGTSLTPHLEKYWTHFQQTFSNDAFWDKDERINFCGQKVKGQGAA